MAEEEQRSALITEFISVTGIDAERATYYLESAEWDIQVVLLSFYLIIYCVQCISLSKKTPKKSLYWLSF